MSKLLLFLLIACATLPSMATTPSNPYFTYPTGHIQIERIYDVVSPKRKALRQCHKQYLSHIPGAFEDLGLQFQIDPEGKVVVFAQKTFGQAKAQAIDCIKSIIRALHFPAPKMGIVFVIFESDLRAHNMANLDKQKLSRNALRLAPYVPQKLVHAMIEMYMPYYKACFVAAPKTKRPMHIDLSWTIASNGQPENIHTNIQPPDQATQTCIQEVTSAHRYPSGYAPTDITRHFEIK